jgi:glyoxylase-like metal-dependent hydrolase (beta-lactamase superfamily II)
VPVEFKVSIDFAMIQAVDYGEVRFFRMARSFFGRAIYWTGVYAVDGLLVDSGPPNLAREVQQLCQELTIRQCVTTHHHEDHSGNDRLTDEARPPLSVDTPRRSDYPRAQSRGGFQMMF